MVEDLSEFIDRGCSAVGEYGAQHATVASEPSIGTDDVAGYHAFFQDFIVIRGVPFPFVSALLPVIFQDLAHELQPDTPALPSDRVQDRAVERPAYSMPKILGPRPNRGRLCQTNINIPVQVEPLVAVTRRCVRRGVV